MELTEEPLPCPMASARVSGVRGAEVGIGVRLGPTMTKPSGSWEVGVRGGRDCRLDCEELEVGVFEGDCLALEGRLD